MALDRNATQFEEQNFEAVKRDRDAIYRGDERLAGMQDAHIGALRDAIRANPGNFNWDAAAARLASISGVKILREIVRDLKTEAAEKVAAAEARVDAARARFAAELEVSHEESAALQAALATTPEQEKAEAAKRHQDKQARIQKRAAEIAAK